MVGIQQIPALRCVRRGITKLHALKAFRPRKFGNRYTVRAERNRLPCRGLALTTILTRIYIIECIGIQCDIERVSRIGNRIYHDGSRRIECSLFADSYMRIVIQTVHEAEVDRNRIQRQTRYREVLDTQTVRIQLLNMDIIDSCIVPRRAGSRTVAEDKASRTCQLCRNSSRHNRYRRPGRSLRTGNQRNERSLRANISHVTELKITTAGHALMLVEERNLHQISRLFELRQDSISATVIR